MYNVYFTAAGEVAEKLATNSRPKLSLLHSLSLDVGFDIVLWVVGVKLSMLESPRSGPQVLSRVKCYTMMLRVGSSSNDVVASPSSPWPSGVYKHLRISYKLPDDAGRTWFMNHQGSLLLQWSPTWETPIPNSSWKPWGCLAHISEKRLSLWNQHRAVKTADVQHHLLPESTTVLQDWEGEKEHRGTPEFRVVRRTLQSWGTHSSLPFPCSRQPVVTFECSVYLFISLATGSHHVCSPG